MDPHRARTRIVHAIRRRAGVSPSRKRSEAIRRQPHGNYPAPKAAPVYIRYRRHLRTIGARRKVTLTPSRSHPRRQRDAIGIAGGNGGLGDRIKTCALAIALETP